MVRAAGGDQLIAGELAATAVLAQLRKKHGRTMAGRQRDRHDAVGLPPRRDGQPHHPGDIDAVARFYDMSGEDLTSLRAAHRGQSRVAQERRSAELLLSRVPRSAAARGRNGARSSASAAQHPLCRRPGRGVAAGLRADGKPAGTAHWLRDRPRYRGRPASGGGDPSAPMTNASRNFSQAWPDAPARSRFSSTQCTLVAMGDIAFFVRTVAPPTRRRSATASALIKMRQPRGTDLDRRPSVTSVLRVGRSCCRNRPLRRR